MSLVRNLAQELDDLNRELDELKAANENLEYEIQVAEGDLEQAEKDFALRTEYLHDQLAGYEVLVEELRKRHNFEHGGQMFICKDSACEVVDRLGLP